MFASTMKASVAETNAPRAARSRFAGAAAAALLFATGAFAQDAARPDQVFWRNPRTGKIQSIAGTVVENSLSAVRVERASGDESRYDASEVVKIVWTSAPTEYQDGKTYLERGDFERALGMFRSAATDSDARDVVQAAARRAAAEAALAFGGVDPNQFAECIAECDRYNTDYPDSRELPNVRWLKGRALLLSGEPAKAAEWYKALYEEGANEPPTAGYDREFCLSAGLDAARAYLAAGDSLPARELYATLVNAFQSMSSALDDTADPALVSRLSSLQGEAAVGEGFCLLASGQADQALDFFNRRLSASDGAAGTERASAMLGLGEAQFAKGDHRAAQVSFAQVSAIDYASRDRRAQALLGLARASNSLGDPTSTDDAKRALSLIASDYADTPSARAAAELLQTL